MKINRCDSTLCESLPPRAIILYLWRRHRVFSGIRAGGCQDLGPEGTGHLALCRLRSPLPFILYKQFFSTYFFLVMKLICNNNKIQSSKINNQENEPPYLMPA